MSEMNGELPRKHIRTSGAAGYAETENTNPKVSVTWGNELLSQINRKVIKNNTSFGFEARRLCALGLRHDR